MKRVQLVLFFFLLLGFCGPFLVVDESQQAFGEEETHHHNHHDATVVAMLKRYQQNNTPTPSVEDEPQPEPSPSEDDAGLSPMSIWIIAFLPICIIFIVCFTVALKLHAFFALILASLIYGFGVNLGSNTVTIVTVGLGNTFGKIGLLVICGVIIGNVLLESNGALVLARAILKVLGKNSVTIAAGYMGYVVSIAVFADSTFIILFPLVKALVLQSADPSNAPSSLIALLTGLAATHTMVPPTPGPLSAALLLDADLTYVIGFGFLVSFVAFQCCLLYSLLVGSRLDSIRFNKESDTDVTRPDTNADPNEEESKEVNVNVYLPPLPLCIVPLILPVILIVIQSVGNFPSKPFGDATIGYAISQAIGNPSMALMIGAASSLFLLEKFDRKQLSDGVVGRSIKDSASILLITGAGGAFGAVLEAAKIGSIVGTSLSGTNLGVLIPMIVAAGIKTAQGSSTVAMITTASLLKPLLPALGMTDPVYKALMVIGIGSSSLFVSHVNDSLFWITSQYASLSVYQTFLTFTVGFGVLAVSGSAYVVVLYYSWIAGGVVGGTVFLLNVGYIVWKRWRTSSFVGEERYLLPRRV